jgi:hypothetical protein
VVLQLNPSARATVPLHSGRAPPDRGSLAQSTKFAIRKEMFQSRVFDTQFAFSPKCPPSRQHFVGHARFSIANCILS